LKQALEPLRGTMETLARANIFDFNDSGTPSTHSLNSVHAISTVTNDPRRDGLAHGSLPSLFPATVCHMLVVKRAPGSDHSVVIVHRRQRLGPCRQEGWGQPERGLVVSAFIATAFAQNEAEQATAQWRRVADPLRPKVAKLAADGSSRGRCAGLHDLPSTAPYQPLERLNGEIKRRTEVVGIFPNKDTITRLVGAILLAQNDEWAVQRASYITLESIASVAMILWSSCTMWPLDRFGTALDRRTDQPSDTPRLGTQSAANQHLETRGFVNVSTRTT
jgi:hypothetical protein